MRCRRLYSFMLCAVPAIFTPAGLLQAGDGGRTTAATHTITHHKTSAINAKAAAFAEEVSGLYDAIDLKELGLTKRAFAYALKGYHYLLGRHRLARPNILSICDMSQSSRNKRLYIVDLEQRIVLVNTYVAHGRNSGREFARSFSNSPSSHKTSLGFYVTEDTYYGNNGLSLKIIGMERGINDRAAGRNIVIHGSEYVGPDFLRMNAYTGRSYGCPAVPAGETEEVIDTIKGGSCLFIYHPTKKYISRSKILNS